MTEDVPHFGAGLAWFYLVAFVLVGALIEKIVGRPLTPPAGLERAFTTLEEVFP